MNEADLIDGTEWETVSSVFEDKNSWSKEKPVAII